MIGWLTQWWFNRQQNKRLRGMRDQRLANRTLPIYPRAISTPVQEPSPVPEFWSWSNSRDDLTLHAKLRVLGIDPDRFLDPKVTVMTTRMMHESATDMLSVLQRLQRQGHTHIFDQPIESAIAETKGMIDGTAEDLSKPQAQEAQTYSFRARGGSQLVETQSEVESDTQDGVSQARQDPEEDLSRAGSDSSGVEAQSESCDSSDNSDNQ